MRTTFDTSEASEHDGHMLGVRVWTEVPDEDGVIATRSFDTSLEDLAFYLPVAVRIVQENTPS